MQQVAYYATINVPFALATFLLFGQLELAFQASSPKNFYGQSFGAGLFFAHVAVHIAIRKVRSRNSGSQNCLSDPIFF